MKRKLFKTVCKILCLFILFVGKISWEFHIKHSLMLVWICFKVNFLFLIYDVYTNVSTPVLWYATFPTQSWFLRWHDKHYMHTYLFECNCVSFLSITGKCNLFSKFFWGETIKKQETKQNKTKQNKTKQNKTKQKTRKERQGKKGKNKKTGFNFKKIMIKTPSPLYFPYTVS